MWTGVNLLRWLPRLNPPALSTGGQRLAGPPDTASAGLGLRLPHLVDPLPNLLLEREVFRALHRRQEPR